MPYKFEQGYNTIIATKNTFVKSEGAVDHNTVTRWCKNLNDQTWSSKPKTMHSKAVLQAIKANPSIL